MGERVRKQLIDSTGKALPKQRGGRRPGAGRPKGSGIRTKATAAKLIKLNMTLAEASIYRAWTPLQIMEACARGAFAAAMADPTNVDIKLLAQSFAWAKETAPYHHPRLIAQELFGRGAGGAILHQQTAGSGFNLPADPRRVAYSDNVFPLKAAEG